MLPSPDTLNDFSFGKYVLSNLAAKRAKQLREGAPPLVNIESHHPLTIALAEIAAGKIKPVLQAGLDPSESGEIGDRAVISDEPLPAELGMLLPALDEAEVALVSTASVGDDDHADDSDTDSDADSEGDGDSDGVVSLADLVGDDEETETSSSSSDDDTLSLSDIAEQETTDEEESQD